MSVEKYIAEAIAEIRNKSFGVTQQYLEVHSVVEENGSPKVERVDFETFEDTVIVYFPIVDEFFFLAIYFSKSDDPKVRGVDMECGNQVYFTAQSDKLTFDELSAMTTLKPITGWNKGDLRRHGKSRYEHSSIKFDPFQSQAYHLEHKIRLLLTILETDPEGIIKLCNEAHSYISVCNHKYINSGYGFSFDKELIGRMSKLNLGLDIDQYIVGKQLLD